MGYATPHNTPILLLGYNRPEMVQKRLAEISNFQVRHVIVSIDGSNLATKQKFKTIIKVAKTQLKNLDSFKVIMHNKNLGLSKHIVQAISTAFIKHPYLIVVEDDICLSEKFYDNILGGLNLLHRKNKNGIVSGFSPIEIARVNHIANRWRSTIYTPIWGWGCSSETWAQYELDLTRVELELELNSSTTWQKFRKFKKAVWLGRFYKMKNYPNITWDYQMQYTSIKKSFTNLVPISRFTNNEGFKDSRAANTKGSKPKWLTIGDVDHRLIINEKITIFSRTIMLADSLTYAGDSKVIYLLNKIRKFFIK